MPCASSLQTPGGLFRPLHRCMAALALTVVSAGAAAQPAAPVTPRSASASTIVKTQCAVCHGERGESTTEQFPQLAGQNRQYLRKQIEDFRTGRREHVAMNQIARALGPAEADALAAWFEQQTPEAHPPADALLAGVGRYVYERGNPFSRVPACVSCHSATGQGNATLPRLAGQHPLYVERQLRRFHTQERRNDGGVMGFVTGSLTELELRAVAVYVGGLTGGKGGAKP